MEQAISETVKWLLTQGWQGVMFGAMAYVIWRQAKRIEDLTDALIAHGEKSVEANAKTTSALTRLADLFSLRGFGKPE